MVKVKGSLMIETLIATVLISIIMLLFSFVLFNSIKEQVKKRSIIKSTILTNRYLDSLRIIPVEQIQAATWEKENLSFSLQKQIDERELFHISIDVYFRENKIYYAEILRHED